MQDLVNTFASAYQSGAAIRNDREQQRLYEDTKNTFSSIMKERDKYGGEEGALREAARRFGESGNVNGFNMATKEAATIRTEKEKIKHESLQHVGAAAVWLYGLEGDKKQEAYSKLYDHYNSVGLDTSQWPKPGNYTDEVGMSLAGVEGSRKFFEEVTYKKSMAEAAKTRASRTGTGGKGGALTSVVQVSEYIYKNRFINPETKKPFSKQESFGAASEFLLSAKKLGKDAWLQKYSPVIGDKGARAMADSLFPEKSTAEKSAEKQLDKDTAEKIFEEAGRDRIKARKLAKERGYKF